MLSNYSSLADEVQALADQLFDGRIDGPRMRRLEALIENDLACLQVYVERMTYHGELVKNAEVRSPAQAALAVMREFSYAVRMHERRRWFAQFWIYGGMVASLLLIVGGALFFTGAFDPVPVGIVAGLSDDAQFSSTGIDLGRFVRRGEQITVNQGMISLQLSNVLVDVLGPASIQLEAGDRMVLNAGSLFAKMLPGANGFTVSTPDVEVVDLGTEFYVQYTPVTGTQVSVRQGRVRASLLDWKHAPVNLLELTDGRSAQFQGAAQLVREVVYQPEVFQPIDQSRGGIQRIDGLLRTTPRIPVSLQSEQLQTTNHMLVIPERQNVLLDRDLVIPGEGEPVRIPAGAVISSYLIHYDPKVLATLAPRGAVTFFDEIAAVTATEEGLKATDHLGLPGIRFESNKFREFEMDEDEVRISQDRKTVSFYCGVNPGEFLDEARVIVVAKTKGVVPAP